MYSAEGWKKADHVQHDSLLLWASFFSSGYNHHKSLFCRKIGFFKRTATIVDVRAPYWTRLVASVLTFPLASIYFSWWYSKKKKERSDYYDDYGNVIAHVSTLLLRSRVSHTFIFLRESLNNGYFEEKTGISTIKLCKFILNFFFQRCI